MKKLALAAFAVMMLALSGCMPATGDAAEGAGMGAQGILMYVIVMAVFFGAMYFIAIRPQKKQEKEQREMLASMMVGDTVLTTSGFYGVVIDITDDTVIVEFGNNKNCRIPMQKAAVIQLEHPEGYAPAEPAENKETEKKVVKK